MWVEFVGHLSLSHTNQIIRIPISWPLKRALMLGSCRYKSIESILKHRLDQQPLEEQQELALPDTHDNIRGPAYYY